MTTKQIGIYSNCQKLGEGTYAVVYRAMHPVTKEYVALKYMRTSKPEEGMDLSTLRELKYLKYLKHENIINLIDAFQIERNIVMVLEIAAGDLEELIKDKSIILSIADAKSIMMMALRGVAYCHMNHILHRDIKPANFLITNDGIIKLADFGLARDFNQDYSMVRPLSATVITSWYRPPELFLEARFYGDKADVWSMACILGELLRRDPLFKGSNDLEVLSQIWQWLGTPSVETWNFKELPKPLNLKESPGVDLKALFPSSPNDCLDLMRRMFEFNPNNRLSATDCLKHSFFVNQPRPTKFSELPKINR
eukprot:NODE_195_length_13287_cov_0.482484.p6 type:complete len:309 gc:universal NODE_195_length_13287_cov_0.482484:4538-5464(+)